MPSPTHEEYRKTLLLWFRSHSQEPDVRDALGQYKHAALVLWQLDLGPALATLEACYAKHPRGGDPWPPLVVLRSLLLLGLVIQPSINNWVLQLSGSRVLRVLAGLPENARPGVGTFYDFFHRLHNGPLRQDCPHQMRPSSAERRRALTPKPKKSKPTKPKLSKKERKRQKRRQKDPVTKDPVELGATERVLAELTAAQHLPNPNDLLGRLSALLLEVGVLESAKRGLLGDLSALVVRGDGSPLRTGASGQGKRVCTHKKREKCDCPRRYSDPDAAWGYDAYREEYFFGHHFYELGTSSTAHDLPLALRLDPGNETDFTASLRAFEHLKKDLLARGFLFCPEAVVLDCGHDALPLYRYFTEQKIAPVIPLKSDAPAFHPQRPNLPLSPRGVPLCKAGAEMAPWGSAGSERKVFICPVKAGTLPCCPLAPNKDPSWSCRPELTVGPSVSVSVPQNPRLCPPYPRNSTRYQELYKERSGCERSNSVKKETFLLERARHRRASFWLIRLHLLALLQHGKAWVAHESADELVSHLLGEQIAQAA